MSARPCGRGVDGTSDELDMPLLKLFQDASFRAAHNLGSFNSINVARVVGLWCRLLGD